MNDIFPSIQQIEKAMHGGGRVIAKRFRFASEVIAILVNRGWSRSFVPRVFRSLDDRDVGSHRPVSFVEEWAKYRASQAHGTTFVEILRQIGVRLSIIAILERRIYTSLVNTCYTEPQLVDIAIEYLLHRRVPITKRDPLASMTHSFSPDQTSRWFAPPEGTFLENSMTPATLLFHNLPFRCSQRKEYAVETALAALPTHNPDTHALHFHTTSWEGANRIIQTTIKNDRGRICLDFGLEPAFYLSQKIQDALGWGYSLGRGSADNEVAILVFSLPRLSLPAPLRFKHLQGEEWTYITGESRRCRRPYAHTSDRPYYEIPEIRGFDFLYGNMVANVSDIRLYGADPIPHDPPKTQLASKTTRGDIFLQEHLVGCLFFQKHIDVNRGEATARSTNRTRRRR
jgi:hypothetical protein